nr:hypothetical protein [uncultured Kingella sp.]
MRVCKGLNILTETVSLHRFRLPESKITHHYIFLDYPRERNEITDIVPYA